MQATVRFLILSVAISLTACAALGPEYTPPALDVPAEWNRLDPSVDSMTHAALVDDLSQWWRGFDDPLLFELVEEALQTGPDLRSAHAGLREARARRGVAVGIPADTLRQRPDVLAAERALAAQTARVGAAEAARYPSFRLSGSIGLEALTWSGLGAGNASTWSLLAGITAPVFDAGRLRAQVEIQDAMREQALVEYEKTVLSALQDVENALVAIVRNQERGEALSKAMDAARTAALLARHRYGAGLIDFQSVLDTERTVLSVEDGLAGARADGVLALIRLYKTLGGGWSPQAKDLSSGKENS
ncbi:MAG TPA: hypothetical protein ENN39_02775 [Desulfonatronum sp.]|nr:hypothetical protein [Desulfonatronum sp.]